MMDTVWMKLTVKYMNKPETLRYFMFGPTGIVAFEPNDEGSLLTAADNQVWTVAQSPQHIMDVLGAIRRTKGVVDEQETESEEESSEATTSNTEASREVHAGDESLSK